MKDIIDREDFQNLDIADPRFADPTVSQIKADWSVRQSMVRARVRLELQAQAILRSLTDGDKVEAGKLYTAVKRGKDHPLALFAVDLVTPFLLAMEPLNAQIDVIEKRIAKLVRSMPIYKALDIKGIGDLALAKIIGELGDLSAYTGRRRKHAMWKRAGLGVIEGERQRLVAGNKDLATLHGYSPARRAVFWVIADCLFRAQGRDENAGPYRKVYDQRKEYELTRVDSKGHAHNRALRYMMKKALRDIQLVWDECNEC